MQYFSFRLALVSVIGLFLWMILDAIEALRGESIPLDFFFVVALILVLGGFMWCAEKLYIKLQPLAQMIMRTLTGAGLFIVWFWTSAIIVTLFRGSIIGSS